MHCTLLLRVILVAGVLAFGGVRTRAAEGTRRAGTAKAVRTPKEPIGKAGYTFRTRPGNGTLPWGCSSACGRFRSRTGSGGSV
jgi:hypothetical protein